MSLGFLTKKALGLVGWWLRKKAPGQFNRWAPLAGGLVLVGGAVLTLAGQGLGVPDLLEAAKAIGVQVDADNLAAIVATLGLAWGILLKLIVNPLLVALGKKPLRKPDIGSMAEQDFYHGRVLTHAYGGPTDTAAETFEDAQSAAARDLAAVKKEWRRLMNEGGLTAEAAFRLAREAVLLGK